MAHGLAEAFLAGSWDLDGLVARGQRVLSLRYRGLRPLATRMLAAFSEGPRPRIARLAEFLCNDEGLQKAGRRSAMTLRFDRWPKPVMTPSPGPPGTWPIPPITTTAELARYLELEPNQLEWFADEQARERKATVESLRHYRYRWMAKRSGSLRLIEAPKPRLKRIQRRLLDEILANMPTHDAAHGFRPGRSVLSFVGPHVGQSIVLKMDLRDFFATISAARVIAIYLAAGYPEPVARLLAGLCTNTVPQAVWKQAGELQGDWARLAASRQPESHYRQPHLPQGARPRPRWPTSPHTGSTPAWPDWPGRRRPITPDTPTTWSSPAATHLPGRSTGSRPTSPRRRWKKGLRSSIARPGSCGEESDSKRRASSSIGRPTCRGTITTASRRRCATACATARTIRTARESPTSARISPDESPMPCGSTRGEGES